MSVLKVSVVGLLALTTGSALAQEEVRGGSPGNSGGDLVSPPTDPGPPSDREDPGNSDNAGDTQAGLLNQPGPPDVNEQLADGTASVFDMDDALIGHVLTRDWTQFGPIDKMETWVFAADSLYQAPMDFVVDVTSNPKDTEVGGVPIGQYWGSILQDAQADGWLYVCLGVNYVNPKTSQGLPASVINDLEDPKTSSYALVRGQDVVGWLFRGEESGGAVGDVYGLSIDYEWPDKNDQDLLEFVQLTGNDAFADVDAYLAFLDTQPLLPKGMGLATYSTPELAGPGTDCDQ